MNTTSANRPARESRLVDPLRSQASRHCIPRLAALFVLVQAWLLCGAVHADFTTIIDSPPANLQELSYVGANTQLNLYPGGVLPASVSIGNFYQNLEINLLGGSIGSEEEPFGTLYTSRSLSLRSQITINLVAGNFWGDVSGSVDALVTMSGATMSGSLSVSEGALAVVSGGLISRGLWASNGSLVQMSGGVVGSGYWGYYDGTGATHSSVFLMSGGVIRGGFIIDDSLASVTGGRIEGELHVSSNGQLDIAGGIHGPINATNGGAATLVGGEFQLDGVPIDGLGGYAQSVELPLGSMLTGVLADGTPVTLANRIGSVHDYFADNRVSLRLAPVPANEPRAFDTAVDPVPAGLRTGQSLTLRSGAVAPANFTALPGSNVSIVGGIIDHGFEAVGATVTLDGGSIGEQAMIYRGTTLRLLDGNIGSNFEAAPGSRLEMRGGTVSWVFVAHPGSEVVYAGGKIARGMQASAGSSFQVEGGEFKLNGTPIAALSNIGAQQQFDLPEFAVLSGTLSDGTPFAFNNGDQYFAPGSLKLQVTNVPAAGPALFRVPTDPAPKGLRSGQTLQLDDGGDVGDQFTADWGSVVRMSGGRIGEGFQAVGSYVNVAGGEIGSINALVGSVINLRGGNVNNQVTARRGAIVNLSAGQIKGGLYAYDGGRVNISGGSLAGYIYVVSGSSMGIRGGVITNDVYLYNGSLTIEAGETRGGILADGSTQVEIRGGRLGDGFEVSQGSRAILTGVDFRIDGEPVFVDSWGPATAVELPARSVLSGVLADGTPFAFTSSEGDRFAPGTLQLSALRFIPLPGISLPLLPQPRGLRPGAKLTLSAGQQVGVNFSAGWGSELTVAGGEVGANFEAVGGRVNVLGGTIGENMDALFGAEVNVRGGTIGYGLEAHRGSVVNISGGEVREIVVRAGSSVQITGGTLGEILDDGFWPGRIQLEGGSAVHLTGTEFRLRGEPVAGLAPGSTVELDWNHSYLSEVLEGTLADGSPLMVYIPNYPSSNSIDWQWDGPLTVTLTATIPGDFDGNLVVDAADYTLWRNNLDGKYDQSDYLAWRNAYGWRSASIASSPVVPEPSTELLILCGIASTLPLRSRKSNRAIPCR